MVAAKRLRWTMALLAAVLVFGMHIASAQTAANPGMAAVLLSDLHFDPFYDPAKVQKLAASPYTEWPAILSTPDSADREAAFTKLNQACATHNSDSSYALIISSLKAAHEFSPQAHFVTVTGDLIGHNFDCHYKTMLPGHSADDYREFVEKGLRLVALELRQAFPKTPIYTLLGNNDTDCGDYHLDPASSFLKELAPVVVDDLALASGAAAKEAVASFAAEGNYTLELPGPMQHARVIALSNIYLSSHYAGCNAKPNPAAAAAEITWLREQLSVARSKHEQVWVLGHVPPGVDMYSTVLHGRAMCEAQAPETFIDGPEFGDALRSGAGVIRLALFAHTHMDEMHYIPAPQPADGIPIKQVSSISPNNGNLPTVTIAAVDPATATMLDYSVYVASNRTGRGTTWSKEYTFRDSYHLQTFNGITLDELTQKFLADREGKTPESQSYLRFYFAGNLGKELKLLWPAYVCTFAHVDAKSFSECMCPAPKASVQRKSLRRRISTALTSMR